ncbi:MAG: electron transfer flavoprotein subunit alpha/FixB family protein [Actinobacteria bacterium]|nr:electron transfer flavoprotein subunit alpha/FixB family protein [Actinomycetota bacterium]
MAGTLVIAEHRRGELRQVTAEMLTALRGAGEALAPTKILLVGAGVTALADQADIPGVDEILLCETSAEHFDPWSVENAIAAVIAAEQPRLIAFGHTVDAMSVAPALAAKLGRELTTDVTALRDEDGAIVVERPIYGGRLFAELELPGEGPIVTIRPGQFDAAGASAARAGRRVVDPQGAAESSPICHVEFLEGDTDQIDITTADFLLAVGRGIGDEDLDRYADLAGEIGATLAVSRPLVDSGQATGARQVGQSGKTVKPRVYLALGISGAPQHLAGMRDADCIIAVNQDPDAPIFGVAHYGVVGDLHEIVDELVPAPD